MKPLRAAIPPGGNFADYRSPLAPGKALKIPLALLKLSDLGSVSFLASYRRGGVTVPC